jgi:Cu2+-exporting ATPase
VSETGKCLQCGDAIRAPAHGYVTVAGQPRPVCSKACMDVAQVITSRGLDRFYQFRESSQIPLAGAQDPDFDWTVYDRDGFQREFTSHDSDAARTSLLLIDGVRCAACTWLIEQALSDVAGVQEIAVDPLTTRMELRWDPHQVRLSELVARIAQLGYHPNPFTEDVSERLMHQEGRANLRRLIVAGLGMMQVMSFAVALYAGAFQSMDPQIEQFLRLISMLVSTPVVFYSGAPFFQGAWRGLIHRKLGMDVPVSVAVGSAYAASVWNTFAGGGEVYFDSATMFVFFLLCARFLELSSRRRALGMYGAAHRHLPHSATRVRDDQLQEVGVVELERGDTVLISSGGLFPVDGELLSDDARIDESMLTGESTHVRKRKGDRVIAGGINTGDPVKIRTTEIGSATVMAQVGRLISGARQSRPPLLELADKIASYFIGTVLVLAALVGSAWSIIDSDRAFEVVLAMLVVTCPCALALATPAAFSVATSTLARRGFMIRQAGVLQSLSRATDVLFDKTGTLTEPSLKIGHTELLGAMDEASVRSVAGALESQSEHPLARAFREHRGIHRLRDVRVVPGEGLEARIDDVRYRIGKLDYVAELSATPPSNDVALSSIDQLVFLGTEQGLLARFDIEQRLRAGAAQVADALSATGLRLQIISGDRVAPVAEIARRLKVDEYRAELSPAEKLQYLQTLQTQGRTVVMIGDGINDSPVLAGADTSVAMGVGMPLAHHSAAAVLLGTDLSALTTAFDLARRTMRVIRQNMAWAVAYNFLALPLAATGLIAPWMAAIGMSASSLLVTANALRLGRLPPVRPSDDHSSNCCPTAPESVA